MRKKTLLTLVTFLLFAMLLITFPAVLSADTLLCNVNTSGRPDLVGTIKTDGTSIIFNIRAVGQADDGDPINPSKYYNQTNFDNEYFTISSAGKFLKYNMFGGNTTPYWGTSWGDATNPLPAGVTFSQTQDGDDFVYDVSMPYSALGINEGDSFTVQIKARDFNDDYVQSYPGYEGYDGEYSQYRGLYITDTGIFDVEFPTPPKTTPSGKSTAPVIIPVPTRTHEMTCWQIWVNEDDEFEFIFWWLYGNNNWVKIYDTNGNIVYEIDMPKNSPCFSVDLPDGFYIVKTGLRHPYRSLLLENLK